MFVKFLTFLWSIKNPRTKVLVNTLIVFGIISFYFWAFNDAYEWPIGKKILYGVMSYGIVLLFGIWQYNKWIRNPKRIEQDIEETSKESNAETKVEIDPEKASFKNNKMILEKYIRAI
jgi:hypothetical protein